MSRKKQEPELPDELRREAEERLTDKQSEMLQAASEADAQVLVHELQVYQIELEIQNEELKQVHDELETRVQERTRELAEANEALRASEKRYRTLFDSMTEGFALHEIICDAEGKPVNYRFLDVNYGFERLMGLSRSEIVGRTVLELQPSTEPFWIETYGRVALTGEPARFEHYRGALGKYLEVYAYSPAPGQFATLMMDVTERTLAEEHKLEFYRQTIRAATNGKLIITEPNEIRELVRPPMAEWEIMNTDELTTIRLEAMALAESERMDHEGANRLSTCIGESTSNALKHAGGGKASIHRVKDAMAFKVEDKGPGIGAMSIPDVVLFRGYSTAGTLGVGYKMMITAADRVYLATGPEGTTVACIVNLQRDSGPSDPLFRRDK